MKEKITIITDDLNHGIINEKEAKDKLFTLLEISQESELLLSAICQFTKRNTQKEIQEVVKWLETCYKS